jgi:hypothetical protein
MTRLACWDDVYRRLLHAWAADRARVYVRALVRVRALPAAQATAGDRLGDTRQCGGDFNSGNVVFLLELFDQLLELFEARRLRACP